MANNVFLNNASALLAASIIPADTVIQVASGFGAFFPSPTGGQFFYATLEDDSGNIEVVQCTSRTGDLLTVVRGQDNTIAQNFTLTVTRVELRITAVTLEGFAQLDGATFTGDIDMNSNSIIDAFINGTSTRMTAGQIVGVPLRGDVDASVNEIVVPSGGGRATAGAVPLVVNTDDLEPQLTTAGIIALAPSIGTRLGESAAGYLRVYYNADFLEMTGDDTDWFMNFNGVDTVDFNGATNQYLFDNQIFVNAGGIDINGGQLLDAEILDFSLEAQVVSGIASTTINYEDGSYVTLNLTANITTLTLSNPPASGKFGTFRIKIVQDSTPRTITWPASVQWPGGTAPTLSTGSGAIDFVDLWTDDGGTTWYGAFNANWS